MKALFFALIFVVTCAYAQLPAPAWLNQIKLSGLSGTIDQRLALINRKTFSEGEAKNLKIADKSVVVKCLEIRPQSVLIQIEDLPNLYELSFTGGITAVDNHPVSQVNTQAVAEPPIPVPTQPTASLILTVPTQPAPPISHGNSSFLKIILLLGVLFFMLVVGTGIASRTTQWPGRTGDSPTTGFKDKGDEGEAMIVDAIGKHFSRPHLLLNNITLPVSEGTTQIDHVLIADTGIFIIETKHFSGWIFGNPNDSRWTQSTYRKKFQFQNPLRQNYGHFKTLQTLLDLPDSYFHSIVVFTGTAEFKTDLGPQVFQLPGLIPFLNIERPVILDEGQRASIIGRIEMKREQRSIETDEYHINRLRSRFGGQTSNSKPVATRGSLSVDRIAHF